MQTQRRILRNEHSEAYVGAVLAKARYRELLKQKGKEHIKTINARDKSLREQANLAEARAKRLYLMLPKAKGKRKEKIEKQIKKEEARYLVSQMFREKK